MANWKTMDVLQQAHHVGLENMSEMEEAVEGLEGPDAGASVARLRGLLSFFNGELRKHFLQEEEGLFPVLSRAIGPMGPVAVMIAEHVSMWQALDSLEEAIEEFEHSASQDVGELRRIASHIVWALRSHIQKEDQMLFPLAEAQLDVYGRQEVDHRIQAGSAGLR